MAASSSASRPRTRRSRSRKQRSKSRPREVRKQRHKSRSRSPWQDRDEKLRRVPRRSRSASKPVDRAPRRRAPSSSSSVLKRKKGRRKPDLSQSDGELSTGKPSRPAKKNGKPRARSCSVESSLSERKPAAKLSIAEKLGSKSLAEKLSKAADKRASSAAAATEKTNGSDVPEESGVDKSKQSSSLAKKVKKNRKNLSPAKKEEAKKEKKEKKRDKSSSPEVAEVKSDKDQPVDAASDAKSKVSDLQKKFAGLGNLGDLQKVLTEERQRLKLFAMKAKQEWEERRERGGTTDDKDYYHAAAGEVFGPSKQFEVEERIGSGVFSNVFKCKDTTDGSIVAVKFIRSNAMMRRVSEKEVEIYRHLSSKAAKEDPEGAKHLISLVGPETFEHRGHLCLVFGLLKCDLRFALQKYGAGKGLQLGTIQQYGQQMFLALRALRRVKIIHADLKPDNMLMSLDKTRIQLIDFGASMHVSEYMANTAYVQPRYYRAPEVMLGVPYDTQVDVWSLGTTLFELATSKILFAGASNNGMIKQMLDICSAQFFPASMRMKTKHASLGQFAPNHFNADGDFLSKDADDNGGRERVLPITRFKKPSRSILGRCEKNLAEPPDGVDAGSHQAMVRHFADLLVLCTKPDPSKRVLPEQALLHAFFKTPGVLS